VSAAAGGGRVPAWLSTHPDPGARGERIAAAIGTGAAGKLERDSYLAQIDGITFGDDPRQGYFRDNVFFHPEMQFRIEFPSGWKTQNTRQAVVAVAPSNDAAIQLALAKQASPQEALRAFLSEEGITPTSSFGGGSGAGSRFRFVSGNTSIAGSALFFEHGGRVFGLLGYATAAAWDGARTTVERAIGSFDRLTDRRALDVSPATIDVVRPTEAMSLEAFARRYDASVPAATLAVINGLEASARVEPGRSYTVVVGGVGG
jgi:predicted Zn-dependent protease